MQQPHTFPLDSRTITLGRDPSNQVVLRGVGISRTHVTIHCTAGAVRIVDNGSSFGIRVNGRAVPESLIEDGSIITLGVTTLRAQITRESLSLFPADPAPETPQKPAAPQSAQPAIVTLGRDSSNTLRLAHPLVSRHHCTATKTSEGGFVLVDHSSTNGTFVNGLQVHRHVAAEGDIVQIGPYRLIVADGDLVQADEYNRVRLEAFSLCLRKGRSILLNNISLSIAPGEFVAILGPSGAGKTTLAQALTGLIPVDEGDIYYNGFPLKNFCAAFNSSIGFVSQHNLVRPELTVWETFWEQSMLRLPGDSLAAERGERIAETMRILDITHLKGRRVAKLSGGEVKRVHIGVELLSSPTILFLDEPLSGLDPGLIHKFMVLFRALCDRGHTLLLTTHTLEQIDMCHRVLFVNKGSIAFDGPPSQAGQALGAESLAALYEKVASDPVPALQKEMVSPHPLSRQVAPDTRLARRRASVSAVRQAPILVRRYARILVRDRRNIALILLQAPLIALLLGLVFSTTSDFLPIAFYFCVTISAIWMGGVNSIREIAREWELFDREFRVGLSAVAFGAAKVVVFCGLGVVQTGLFAVALKMLFSAFTFDLAMFILIASGCASGSLLGLCVSSLCGNVNRAISWLPIVFIPQIFLSGILIPFDRMPLAGRLLSHLTLSRPLFSLFKKTCVLQQNPWTLTEWKSLALLCAGLIILMAYRVRMHRPLDRSR